ncbi:MAG: hypothetical protein IKW95_00555 [Lachnospiraceae bacterium]|nr:hypothetical protein [Lachnospiraceae bacterium]
MKTFTKVVSVAIQAVLTVTCLIALIVGARGCWEESRMLFEEPEYKEGIGILAHYVSKPVIVLIVLVIMAACAILVIENILLIRWLVRAIKEDTFPFYRKYALSAVIATVVNFFIFFMITTMGIKITTEEAVNKELNRWMLLYLVVFVFDIVILIMSNKGKKEGQGFY